MLTAWQVSEFIERSPRITRRNDNCTYGNARRIYWNIRPLTCLYNIQISLINNNQVEAFRTATHINIYIRNACTYVQHTSVYWHIHAKSCIYATSARLFV